jgi:hypothetical protein
MIFSWHLADGDALHREHPRAFEIPDAQERRELKIDEVVKLLFEYPVTDGEIGGEQMFVRITDADHPQYAGVLVNEPFFAPPDLERGMLVRFEARHIIDI